MNVTLNTETKKDLETEPTSIDLCKSCIHRFYCRGNKMEEYCGNYSTVALFRPNAYRRYK